jgi:hypothetical protein
MFYNNGQGSMYKTFYSRSLQTFIINKGVCPLAGIPSKVYSTTVSG